jgi:hypothetical protein
VLPVISYVLFVAALVASTGLYLYTKYLNRQLDDEVQTLGADIANFNERDMDDIREFNLRLEQAQNRLDNAAAITTIFDAIETATARSVQIDDLTLIRNGDTDYAVTAKLKTDSFDTALFQRSLLEGSKVASAVEVTDLSINAGDKEQQKTISLTTKITIPLTSVPYTSSTISLLESAVAEPQATSTASTTSLAETATSSNQATP